MVSKKEHIAERQRLNYENNKDAILMQQKERYNKIKIRLTNKNMDLDIVEKKKRFNARSYARKTPLKKECGICKTTERLERYHWDYNKPLLVSTLCNQCHEIQHIRNFGGSKFG